MRPVPLTPAQTAALRAACRDGAVCRHSRWTYTTETLKALERRGLLEPVPKDEAGETGWYRPTPAGIAADEPRA